MSDPSLTSYKEYRQIDLPWLKSIPSHWQILRCKEVFRPIDIRSTTGEEELLTVSSERGVAPRRDSTVTMFQAASYVGHKLCWPGDLVINSLWAWAGGLGFSRLHGIISSAYGVYRPRPEYSGSADYFDFLLRSSPYQWEFQTRSKGVWT
jgi:type I restriction enzyme, S subunit